MKIRIQLIDATPDEYMTLHGVPAVEDKQSGGTVSHQLINGDSIEFDMPEFVSWATLQFLRGSFARELSDLAVQQVDRAKRERDMLLLRDRAALRARVSQGVKQ